MKCLKCDKEAVWGNYCEDHKPEIDTEQSKFPREKYNKNKKKSK